MHQSMAIFSKENTFFFLYLDFNDWIKHYQYEVALTSSEKSCSSTAQYNLDYHLQVQNHIMSSELKDFKTWSLNYIWIQTQ